MSTVQQLRPAPGWYRDPSDPRRLRWWDGAGWSGYVSPDPGRRKKGARPGRILVVATILALVAVLALSPGLPPELLLQGSGSDPVPPPAAPVAPREIDGLASAYQASVMVQSSCGAGCLIVGGAVAISETELLTAEHVISQNDTVMLVDAMGNEFVGQVISSDAVRDLALLRTPSPHGLPIVAIRAEDAVIGEESHAVGAPEGVRRISDGYVTDVLDIERDGVLEVQTSADVDRGNSGGPLLDAQGRLLGIVVAEHEFDDTVGWATAASEVQAFLAGSVRSGGGTLSPQYQPGAGSYEEMLSDLFRQFLGD